MVFVLIEHIESCSIVAFNHINTSIYSNVFQVMIYVCTVHINKWVLEAFEIHLSMYHLLLR